MDCVPSRPTSDTCSPSTSPPHLQLQLQVQLQVRVRRRARPSRRLRRECVVLTETCHVLFCLLIDLIIDLCSLFLLLTGYCPSRINLTGLL